MPLELDRLIDAMFSPRTLWMVLWGGLVLLTLALLVLMRTRWGQAKPLSKCIVLSVLAHALIMGYASMTKLFSDYPARTDGEVIQVTLYSGDQGHKLDTPSEERPKPWDRLALNVSADPRHAQPDRRDAGLASPSRQNPVSRWPAIHGHVPDFLPAGDRTIRPPTGQAPTDSPRDTQTGVGATTIRPPKPRQQDPEPVKGPAGQELDRASLRDQIIPLADRMATSSQPAQQLHDPARLQRLAELPISDDRSPALTDVLDNLSQSSKLQDSSARIAGRPLPAEQMTPATASAGDGRQPDDSDLVKVDLANSAEQQAGPKSRGPAPVPTDKTARHATGNELPDAYQLRTAPDRMRVARQHGGNVRTEAAVRAALRWLAANQNADGRWDASAQGAGRETRVAGHDRFGAGVDADTGITGLAVLAFLASGHTHLEGKYRKHVQHGLEFLLRSQSDNGNLAGAARTFAVMYCHGMAALALSEAYAMTGDRRIRPYLERAVAYSISAQHPATGGWRYRPGDLGDMSQFGWQVMALKSAELGGIHIPRQTKTGMHRFLRSCCRGTHGGLASYRPAERISPTMTAEALACRFFLDLDHSDSTVDEAAAYLLAEPPSGTQTNLYYWYYATLALHQLQDDHWQRWNEALQARLLPLQRTGGPLAGSWDPDTVWGAYGGRVYSTALATLCLEVYYRFLPLQADSAPAAAP